MFVCVLPPVSRVIIAVDCRNKAAAAGVLDVAEGGPDIDVGADRERVQVLGHEPAVGELRELVLEVHLHEELEVAGLVHGARRRVRPHAQLPVDGRAHQDVLAHGRPSTWSSDGSAKRNRRAPRDSSSLPTRRQGTFSRGLDSATGAGGAPLVMAPSSRIGARLLDAPCAEEVSVVAPTSSPTQ